MFRHCLGITVVIVEECGGRTATLVAPPPLLTPIEHSFGFGGGTLYWLSMRSSVATLA